MHSSSLAFRSVLMRSSTVVSAPLQYSLSLPSLRRITDMRLRTLLKSRMLRSSYVASCPNSEMVIECGVRD